MRLSQETKHILFTTEETNGRIRTETQTINFLPGSDT